MSDNKSKQETVETLIARSRNDIDHIDEQILTLINQRLRMAEEIGELKERNGCKVLDSARESEVLNRLFSLNQGPVTKTALQHIFAEIMAASREIQKPQTIAYLGPEATFSHIAALSQFGHTCRFLPQSSIRDIFTAVERERADYGVVPAENSIEGSVNHTLDLLFESDLKICAEKYQAISHYLLSQTGNIKDVGIVYSHPQPLAQCREWLRKYLPDCELAECRSTAVAAQKASEDKQAAAIASNEAAQIYNLKAVASKIEDFSRNVTRFLVIGPSEVKRTGRDKTSVMFVTAHQPGALFQVLKPISDANINMVKLESRPIKHENWSYFFFVDMEGHMADPEISNTVKKMKKRCLHLKWLGSYPMARR